jgi:hypothetical protein
MKIINLLQLESYLNYLVEFYYDFIAAQQAPDKILKAYIDGTIDGFVGVLKAMNPHKYENLKYSFEI